MPTVGRILVDEVQIKRRVDELAAELGSAFQSRQPMTVLAVLTGSFIFVADLCRRLQIPHRIGVVRASSYRGATVDPSDLHTDLSLAPDVRGRHVLLVDDILDTGATLARLVREIAALQPASITTAVLLRKIGRQTVPIEPDYVGFDIPDLFVVGYGLDYNDDYRHLPYIAALEQETAAT